MQSSRREHSKDASVEACRIVTGPDPDRFYCPYVGCNRSFAELWRLKVHFRAPPDVRGSGKERGHGTELKFCPKCGKELKAGKHHVGCSAGKSAPRQAAKRQRQLSMTTESDWVTPSSTATTSPERESDSWEDTVRRQVNRTHRVQSVDVESGLRSTGVSATAGPSGAIRTRSAGAACRIVRMQQTLADGNAELVFNPNSLADFGLVMRAGSEAGGGMDPPHDPLSLSHEQHAPAATGASLGMDQPPGADSLQQLLPTADSMPPGDVASAADMLRVPSPPPLPPDWDAGGSFGALFDFDQFDTSRRPLHQGLTAPVMTVTSAMEPSEMSNPSDDYIWQILFAGENDSVPKRVTAHLHHPSSALPPIHHHHHHQKQQGGEEDNLAAVFDDDAIIDAMPWPEQPEGAAGRANGGSMQPPQQQHPFHQQPQQEARVPAAADMPPPPPEVLAAMAGRQPEVGDPQTVTVTYVLQPGPAGKLQYTVQHIDGVPVADEGGTAAAAAAPTAAVAPGSS